MPGVMPTNLRWMEIVRWSVYAMIDAEEMGLSQHRQALTSDDPICSALWARAAGLARCWESIRLAFQIVKQVGNYGESYDRNIKPSN